MARKRLTGRVDVQKLYEDGKMHTDEFYHGVTNLIKWLLMKCLIAKGHWKNGIRQTNFDQEDVDDCFTYVFGKIKEKYDPSRGTLATFIRTWVRGYGTVTTQKQRRQHKYLKKLLPIDYNLQKSIAEDYKDPYHIEDLENYIDDTYFNQVDENLRNELFDVLGEDINSNGWDGLEDE